MIFPHASYFREFRNFYKNRENKMYAANHALRKLEAWGASLPPNWKIKLHFDLKSKKFQNFVSSFIVISELSFYFYNKYECEICLWLLLKVITLRLVIALLCLFRILKSKLPFYWLPPLITNLRAWRESNHYKEI